ncbi:unnamed protein product [Lathyrus sativus]|nr:unnamed protein product [Lathyrus sativus]
MALLWMGDEHHGTQQNIQAKITSFSHISKINSLEIDSSLVVALLENWRPETHMFHFSTGECTITLEDVNMLLGLRVDEKAINGPTEVTNDVYMESLGVEPTEANKNRGSVRIMWLENLYEVLKNNSAPTEEHIVLQAKVYILLVIVTILFPDKSQNLLHSSWIPFIGDLEKCGTFSWGSACLTKLYREMCKATVKDVRSMSGCVLLLTSWAFTCIPLFAPVSTLQLSYPYAQRWAQRRMNYNANPRFDLQGYRNTLDHMQEKDFIWRPYIQYPVPNLRDNQIRSATTSLICFYIIEMYQTNRVKLQFGFEQQIPSSPRCLREHHAMSMRKAQKVH